MTKRRKWRVLAFAALAALLLSGCKEFDAKGYVQASLDAMFQGETDALMAFEEGSKKSELEEEYEEYIASFAAGLTEGLNVSDGMQLQFDMLCEEIFRSMRYNVESSEKVSRKEYRVRVEYEPSDVFVKWTEYLAENAVDINERAESGEYQGTKEEQLEQILLDIAAESCELLDTAMWDAAYGEKEETTLTVKKGEDGEFSLEEGEIDEFVGKIMRLDAIRG